MSKLEFAPRNEGQVNFNGLDLSKVSPNLGKEEECCLVLNVSGLI